MLECCSLVHQDHDQPEPDLFNSRLPGEGRVVIPYYFERSVEARVFLAPVFVSNLDSARLESLHRCLLRIQTILGERALVALD